MPEAKQILKMQLIFKRNLLMDPSNTGVMIIKT